MDLRRTDEWDKFYPIHLSFTIEYSMVAVAGGEVWTCDEHTNEILLHVCCMIFVLVVRSVSSLRSSFLARHMA